MRTTVAKQARRCGHPKCDDPIERGETYGVVDGVAYHLECALIVEAEKAES